MTIRDFVIIRLFCEAKEFAIGDEIFRNPMDLLLAYSDSELVGVMPDLTGSHPGRLEITLKDPEEESDVDALAESFVEQLVEAEVDEDGKVY